MAKIKQKSGISYKGLKPIIFEDFKLEAIQRILLNTIYAWMFSIILMFSEIARMAGIFFIIELTVLLIWYISVYRKTKKSMKPKESRMVRLEKLSQPLKIIWIFWAIIMAAGLVWNYFTHQNADTSSVYGIVTLISDYLAPFILTYIPIVITGIIKAICNNDATVAEREADEI